MLVIQQLPARHFLQVKPLILLHLKLAKDLQVASLDILNGKEYDGEYSGITDKMGSPKENPVSHISYGYAHSPCHSK